MSLNYYNKNIIEPFCFRDEIWKPITDEIVPGVKPIYQISNYGRIYSNSNSRTNSNHTGRILRPNFDDQRYIKVGLFRTNGSVVTRRINRLVLMVFRPIEHSELYEAHHIDGNFQNNYLGNLVWLTPEEHQRITKATWPTGINSKLNGQNGSNVKLTKEQVLEIKNRIIAGDYGTFASLAKEFNTTASNIWRIVHNCSWHGYGEEIPEHMFNVISPHGFTNDEIENICKWLESHDINNKDVYKSMYAIITHCYFDLGLNIKYGDNVEFKRKLLCKILCKTEGKLSAITNKYNYYYDR